MQFCEKEINMLDDKTKELIAIGGQDILIRENSREFVTKNWGAQLW